jgi:hypothetical protein
MTWIRTLAAGSVAATLIVGARVEAQQPPAQPGTTRQDQIAALKASLQDGLARIPVIENSGHRPGAAQ